MPAGENGCVVEVHSVRALWHMDNAGALGLGLRLGFPKHKALLLTQKPLVYGYKKIKIDISKIPHHRV